MSVKSLAYDASRLFGISRSHAYELIAAAFGYRSYAACKADAILIERSSLAFESQDVRRARIEERYAALTQSPGSGSEASAVLERLIAERGCACVRIADILPALLWWREYESEHPSELPNRTFEHEEPDLLELFANDGPTADLVEALNVAAEGSNPLAHYALAVVHEWSHYAADSAEIKPYWHQQRMAGHVLSAAASEWADQYERWVECKRLYEIHLRAAAKLGSSNALFELACNFGEPEFFDGGHGIPQVEPSELARLAMELKRPEQAHRYLTDAAECCDTDAMRELIRAFDTNDPVVCWKWIYLARLCGVDLMKDQYVAIHEDGSLYDDDVGGPLFVDGESGIELNPIDADGDIAARNEAQRLFKAGSGFLET